MGMVFKLVKEFWAHSLSEYHRALSIVQAKHGSGGSG
jgi:hypothetical protein